MDIISYDKEELENRFTKRFSKLLVQRFNEPGFEKNPALTRYISKLSEQYNRYKETYKFPTKFKGITHSNNFVDADR